MLSEATTTSVSTAVYLRTLPAIRERCSRVFDKAQNGELRYFDYSPEKEQEVVKFCAQIIERDFGTSYASIPPHGRWNHFDLPVSPGSTSKFCRASHLLASLSKPPYNLNAEECAKSLIDLFVVSVLLDAGAGERWKYTEAETGVQVGRSEGLALASLEMFRAGLFSGSKNGVEKYRVDATGLSSLTTEAISEGLQVSEANPMSGLAGRADLLLKLANVLQDPTTKHFFGEEGRPGGMIGYLKTGTRSVEGETSLHISSLWEVVLEGLAGIWPTKGRVLFGGITLGDVWPCAALLPNSDSPPSSVENYSGNGDDLVPFHKLSQWLTYSLVPILELPVSEGGLGWKVEGMEDMTGLPEYRNGGLFVDFGVLTLKEAALETRKSTIQVKSIQHANAEFAIPVFEAGNSVVVEWRAMTVILLDRIHKQLQLHLGVPDGTLNLAQVLEAASWKGGREIAASKRVGGGPPIAILSDGTVF